jgi:uncharacterized protein (TIGR01777 family)
MNLLVTGGTGFIGRALCAQLTDQNHAVTVLSRRPDRVQALCGPGIDGMENLPDPATNHFDIIINLAGEPIADKRWSKARKRNLLDSRVGVTEKLLSYIEKAPVKPRALISGSAVGYYGDRGDRILDESADYHPEFSHDLCQLWEETAIQAQSLGVRVCLLRTGLVIGKDGGFLQKMILPFKLGLGGKLGNGQQWMPWMHLADMVGAICHLIDHETLSGPFNLCSPNPVRNEEFTRMLGMVLKRPTVFNVPSWALRAGLGEMSELLLGGQRAIPTRLLASGYNFKYENLAEALRDSV